MIEKQRYQRLYNRLQRDGSPIYVGELLKHAHEKWPNKLAVICEDQKITYRELYIKAAKLSEKFDSLKLKQPIE